MFERFTEQARRAIFFARYEASQFGSQTIELEHLLLGVLREYPGLSFGTREAVRKEIELRSPVRGDKVSTSVDLPLSLEMKRALVYAKEQVKESEYITPKELLYGVLRIEESLAAQVMRQFNIPLISEEPPPAKPDKPAEEEPDSEYEPTLSSYASVTLAPFVDRLERLVAASEEYLNEIGEVGADHELKRKPWTRRETLGHLIDWASTYHQWLARVMTEPRLSAHSYPQEEWVRVQGYQKIPWRRLVRTWVNLNKLVTHVAARIPEEKLSVPCRVGIDAVKPFIDLFRRYVEQHEDLLGQILARD
jgi:hypothetical protein